MLRKLKNKVRLYFAAPSRARVSRDIRAYNKLGIASQKFFDGEQGYARGYK